MTPTVFISYSHDSGSHEDRVLALADQLRADGVDARLDQYEQSPPGGWARWVEHQIQACTFVVLVFTPTYRSRYELAQTHQTTEPDHRVTWEAMTVRHLLYTAGGRNTKMIPVLFEGAVEQIVPLSLRGYSHYRLPERYEDLLRRLLDQPRRPAPPVGPRRTLKPDPRPSFQDLMGSGVSSATQERVSPTDPNDTSAQAPVGSASHRTTSVPPRATSGRLTLPPLPSGRLTLVVFTAGGAEPRQRLRQDKELREIKRALGSRCHLVVSPMASMADVVRDLDEHRPALVHFSGHTDHASGHLVLQSQHQSERGHDEIFVSPEQIAELLAKLQPAPTLVTFTACFSTTLAEAAARHARFSIGFEHEYHDPWAPKFCSTFYERLTSHATLDVPRALEMTKITWESEGQDPAGLAVLYRGPGSETTHAPTPALDVLVITALREELDALLAVTSGVHHPWTPVDGDPPRHEAILEGKHGRLRVAAVRLTEIGGIATATVAAPLLDALRPRSLAMCGVCAGQPDDTDRGDVVIADRVFQHDHGKIKDGGFQGDLWVSTMDDPWLRAAQDLVGPATGLHGHAPASEAQGRWWFLEQLRDGRDPLGSSALRRYVPDERRAAVLEALLRDELVQFQGGIFTLTPAGRDAVERHLVLHGTLVGQAPYHVHVGPMGSGNAVIANGEIWARLARGGMRKALAVEMEAATVGALARRRSLPFAVAKGVMDHADAHKSDRFKAFAARASAEVLCALLRRVVVPERTGVPQLDPALRPLADERARHR